MANLGTPVTPPTKPFIPTSTKTPPAVLLHSNQQKQIQRRNVALGLGGAVLGLSLGGSNASGAGRRPPPPPEEEKKDPNVTGLAAKVLASKKRKEVMKESIAKLREKGKTVQNQ